MRRASAVAVPLLIVALVTTAAAADQFMFGGLGLSATPADARRLYPRSKVSDDRVTVAAEDVRDSIRGIDLPGTGTNRRLRVFFERTTARGAQYPPCDLVLTPVTKTYGPPSNVQEFDEERARNRRYIWSQGREEMTLLCFRLGQGPFSASDLTIAPRP